MAFAALLLLASASAASCPNAEDTAYLAAGHAWVGSDAAVPEDPVCGSGNGCVAALVRRDGVLKARSYVARQGRRLGRDGRVTVQFDDSTIWLGGHAVTCVEGLLQT